MTTLGIDYYTRHADMICLCRYGHHAETMINKVDWVEMLVQVLSIWSPALLDLVASRVDQSSQSPAVQQVM